MNFRELTNFECALTRQWIPAEHTRTDFEKDILPELESAKAQYFANGGTMKDYVEEFIKLGGQIQQLPPGNALRDTDGENWKQTNDRKWQVKQDKEKAK
jgi:hypothetical protein